MILSIANGATICQRCGHSQYSEDLPIPTAESFYSLGNSSPAFTDYPVVSKYPIYQNTSAHGNLAARKLAHTKSSASVGNLPFIPQRQIILYSNNKNEDNTILTPVTIVAFLIMIFLISFILYLGVRIREVFRLENDYMNGKLGDENKKLMIDEVSVSREIRHGRFFTPLGLNNPSKYCFVNSGLQLLANTRLRHYKAIDEENSPPWLNYFFLLAKNIWDHPWRTSPIDVDYRLLNQGREVAEMVDVNADYQESGNCTEFLRGLLSDLQSAKGAEHLKLGSADFMDQMHYKVGDENIFIHNAPAEESQEIRPNLIKAVEMSTLLDRTPDIVAITLPTVMDNLNWKSQVLADMDVVDRLSGTKLIYQFKGCSLIVQGHHFVTLLRGVDGKIWYVSDDVVRPATRRDYANVTCIIMERKW